MIDINDPWVWTKNKQKSVAPLAATITPSMEGAPQNMVLPEQKDPTVEAMKNGVLNEGLRAAEAGVAKDATAGQIAGVLGGNAAAGAGSQAAMLAEQTAGMGSAGLSATAEAAGAGSQALGPLGAAIGGLAEGNYGKAAGAAAGSVIGNSIVPVIGGYIGSALGGSLGSILGFEEGTTNVQPSGGKNVQVAQPTPTMSAPAAIAPASPAAPAPAPTTPTGKDVNRHVRSEAINQARIDAWHR